MPHLIIESSISIEPNVVEELHQFVGKLDSVSIGAVKTRLFSPLLSFTGDQLGSKHTAITLKLLPGRSSSLKEQMASQLYDRASQFIQEGTLSVEVVDLGTYKK